VKSNFDESSHMEIRHSCVTVSRAGAQGSAVCLINSFIWIGVTITSLSPQPDPQGRPKVLLVGGGIANFTNVAATFKGLIKALREFDAKLKAVNARIYVRRAGPNYQEGLRMMRELDGVSRHQSFTAPMKSKETWVWLVLLC
jgi:hypothetical protein